MNHISPVSSRHVFAGNVAHKTVLTRTAALLALSCLCGALAPAAYAQGEAAHVPLPVPAAAPATGGAAAPAAIRAAANAAPVLPLQPLPEDVPFPDLLTGKYFPTALKLGQLAGWHKVAVASMAPSASMTIGIMSGANAGSGEPIYTQGKIINSGGEKLLVGYRIQVKMPGIFEMSMAAQQGRQVNMPRLNGDTPVTLTLLNMRFVAALGDMRPFDLPREMSEAIPQLPGQEAAAAGGPLADATKEQNDSAGNLRQVALAFRQYAADHGGKLPQMDDAAALKKWLRPYLAQDSILQQPDTGIAYLPNARLSGVTVKNIEQPGEVVLLFEARAAANGRRVVLMVDNKVKLVTDEEFAALRTDVLAPAAHP